MKLVERIHDARLTIRERSRLLRRVRALYFAVMRERIMTDPTLATLQRCVENLKASQLYSEFTGDHDLRWSIMRKMWRLDVRDGLIGDDSFSWHRWRARNNWDREREKRELTG